MKGWIVFFEEKTPAENTLCGVAAELVCEVLVISVDMENGTKKHQAELFECFDDGEKFLFDRRVVSLSCVEFSCVESDGVVILFDDCAELKIRGICFDVEWFIVVWVYEHCVSLNESFHLLKDFIVDWKPRKFLG